MCPQKACVHVPSCHGGEALGPAGSLEVSEVCVNSEWEVCGEARQSSSLALQVVVTSCARSQRAGLFHQLATTPVMQSAGLGWPYGQEDSVEQQSFDSFLPPFANAANRQLDEEIKVLQRELQAARLQAADHEDRAVVMSDHLGNVQKETRHLQSRLAAQKDEIAGEEHLRRIAAREEVEAFEACSSRTFCPYFDISDVA